ncbi:Pentatricopeptide repeat-containing protein [Zostera marina]|uniref:Pentatricopeptide repeat-containing protein n=1 Tax=Zostera marina TaxID=29655 RepID=A0A0K9P193_ZOSMR|nr:Pentatricopeptide repeat-containing protein [Zostera marina]
MYGMLAGTAIPVAVSSIVSAFYQRCKSMEAFKQLHARFIILGHRHLPHSALRPIISFSSLHPTGDLHYAILILLSVPIPLISTSSSSRYLFNTVIRGFARRQKNQHNPTRQQQHSSTPLLLLLLLLRRMVDASVSPNNFTYTFLIQACAVPSAMLLGWQIHSVVTKNAFLDDRYVRNSLLQFYSICCGLDETRRLFTEFEDYADVVSWNSLINACLKRGEVSEAFVLFDRMPEKTTVSWNNMMTGLIRHKRLDTARVLFDEMPERNIVSWTVMISGYSQAGEVSEALGLFRLMQMSHRNLNSAVLVAGLAAASQLGALEHGKWIHGYIRKRQVRMERSLTTALVKMYANCGCVDLAMQVFYDDAVEKDVSTYTAAVLGLAVSGHGREAMSLFKQMKCLGIEPDGVSYIAVLCACSHMGWVEEGSHHFNEMVHVYGIEPELDHYACMVDLLGRAGHLQEAEKFITSMPVEADNVVWGALLNACRIHGNPTMGRKVGKMLIESDCGHDGRYIALSNLYSESRMEENAQQIRRIMKKRNVERIPGISSVDLNGTIYES